MITRLYQQTPKVSAAEERIVLALTVALFFAFGLGFAFVDSASNALFISSFGPSALPYAYIASALLIGMAGTLYFAMERRLSLDPSMAVLLILIFVGTSCLWLALWLTAAPLAMFAAVVWSIFVRGATLLVLWTIGMRLFPQVQGPVSIGTIGNWELLARAFGFLIAFAVVQQWTATDVFLGATISYGVAAGIFLVLLQKKQWIFTAQSGRSTQRYPLAQGDNSSSIWLMVGSSFVAAVTHFLISYLFFVHVSTRHVTAESLLSFIGLLMGCAALAAFVARKWIAPTLLRRLGMPAVLLVLPGIILLLLLVSSISSFVVLNTLSGGLVVVVALYLSENVLRSSFYTPASVILHQLLAPQNRGNQSVSDYAIVSAAVGVSGLILYVVQGSGYPLSQTVGILLGFVSAMWLLANLRLARLYPHLLSSALKRQSSALGSNLGGHAAFDIPDRAALEALELALFEADAAVQIYSINCLTRVAPDRLVPHLAELMLSPSASVSIAAIQSCTAMKLSRFIPTLVVLLDGDSEIRVRVKSMQAVEAIDPVRAAELAAQYVDCDIPELVVSAITIVLRQGDAVLHARAVARIQTMTVDPDPNIRLSAARILREDASESDEESIRRLLRDDDPDVKKAALDAVNSRTCGVVILRDIVELMSNADLRAQGQAVLFRAGEQAVPVLEDALLSPSLKRPVRVALIEICGALDDSRTTALLLAQINDAADDVRSAALNALQQLNYRAGEYMRERLLRQAAQELGEAAALIVAGSLVERDARIDKDAAALLLRAIEQAWHMRRNNALHRLSFLGSARSTGDAIRNLGHVSRERRELATEILLVSFSAEQRSKIQPFLREMTLTDRAGAVGLQYSPASNSTQSALLVAKEIGRTSGNEWLQACADYALSTIASSARTDPTPDPNILAANDLRPSYGQPMTRSKDSKPDGEFDMMTTIHRVLFLRSVGLFASVPDDVLAWVADAAVEVFIPRGKRFITQGELGDALFIVINGSTDIVIDGKGVVATREAKSVLGEMGVLTQMPRTANCVAASDIVALKLIREDFLDLMTKAPQLALGIIDVLVQRLDDVSRRVAIEPHAADPA